MTDHYKYSQPIKDQARREWDDENSISNKNRNSIPESARCGFVVLADMGGACLLDPSGRFRVFLHRDQTEIDVTGELARAAFHRLAIHYPQIAELIQNEKNGPEFPAPECSD